MALLCVKKRIIIAILDAHSAVAGEKHNSSARCIQCQNVENADKLIYFFVSKLWLARTQRSD